METACFDANVDRNALRANVNKASKQAKRGECLPCEHGKKSSASTELYRVFTISKVNLNLQYFYLIEIRKSEVQG